MGRARPRVRAVFKKQTVRSANNYHQPLFGAEAERKLFYVPEFFGMPRGTQTTNTLHYSIAITTSPDCSLSGTNLDKAFTLQPSQSITLTPAHLQPIRAVVKRAI